MTPDFAATICPAGQKSPPHQIPSSPTSLYTNVAAYPQSTHNGFAELGVRSAEMRTPQHPGFGAVSLCARVGERSMTLATVTPAHVGAVIIKTMARISCSMRMRMRMGRGSRWIRISFLVQMLMARPTLLWLSTWIYSV